MKKILLPMFILLTAVFSTLFVACDDDDEEDGRQAAKEFCNCLDEGYTLSKCQEKFEKNYKSRTSDDFKKGFDAEGKYCDIELIITRN